MNIMEVISAYLTTGGILLLLLIGLGFSVSVPGLDRWNRRFFFTLFLTLTMCMIISIVDMSIYSNPSLVQVEKITIFMEYLFFSLPTLMMTAYFLRCSGENWRKSEQFRGIFVLWCVYLLLLVAAQFTTSFYYITPENLFYRGKWHILLTAPQMLIIVINLKALIDRRNKLSPKYFRTFLIFNILSVLFLIAQMFSASIVLLDISIAVCSLVLFVMVLSYEIEQYTRQQQEIAHQRANIMVLQMRPHFIYNTMMSIYYLCEQDPRKAQQVTLDFTAYLRKNFTAIASEEMIPFSEELEHTRAYLAVEKAQFEDQLFVEYDTPHTMFRLPPLTLQPIVENAVKHGMDPDSEPLRITIRTRRTDSGSVIIVEDNGSGPDSADNTGLHIALTNIQQRLEMMCRGKLEIAPREGGGTAVRVTI